MNSFLLLINAGLIASVFGQQLSSFFDAVRLSHTENLIQKAVHLNQSSTKNYYSALKLHSLTSSDQIPCNCNFLSINNFSGTDFQEVFYGEKINKLCQCGLKISNLDSEAFEKVVEARFIMLSNSLILIIFDSAIG
jgi:hypothetical protein